jgi:hypothetical protein
LCYERSEAKTETLTDTKKGEKAMESLKNDSNKKTILDAKPSIRMKVIIIVTMICIWPTGFCNAGSILIDNYYSSWVSGTVDSLITELEAAGHTVQFNDSSITTATLNNYDVYTVFFPGQTHEVSAAEADIIVDWVENGGGLWLGGSAGGMGTTGSCNAISSHWGIEFNSDNYSEVVTDITYGHVVTDGLNPPNTRVDSFGIDIASTLYLTGGLSLARYGGLTVMAGTEPGLGRAVLIGDSVSLGPFDNDHLYEYDNRQLALNTIDYLVVPEPATICLLGLGALSLLRSSRRRSSCSRNRNIN